MNNLFGFGNFREIKFSIFETFGNNFCKSPYCFQFSENIPTRFITIDHKHDKNKKNVELGK